MTTLTKTLTLLGCFAAGLCATASAQDSGALLEALVRKGILSDQEAEDIRADLSRDYALTNINVTPTGRAVSRISLSGRVQAQFDHLATDNDVDADPSSINHFFLRRVYLGARASFGPHFSGNLVYDFAGSRFDAAVIEYAPNSDLTVGAGLRKVDFGYEERTSSTRLKAIERSGITRYFVEDNNGRRLGAGAHRVGVFANGKVAENFFYGAAVTNPERASTAALSAATGNANNNNFAYWANAGYKAPVSAKVPFTTGAGFGFLPDQGGFSNARSSAGANTITGPVTGNHLWVGSVYADVTLGRFGVSAEYFVSGNENGAYRANSTNGTTVLGNQDADSSGYYIQPTFAVTEKLELVARYSYTDTDGRGIGVGDGVRNAASTVNNYNTLTDYYFGFNYYFKGTDVKFSAGYVYGLGEDRLTAGGNRESEVTGIRSQVQVVF